jgi:hypothetical protein
MSSRSTAPLTSQPRGKPTTALAVVLALVLAALFGTTAGAHRAAAASCGTTNLAQVVEAAGDDAGPLAQPPLTLGPGQRGPPGEGLAGLGHGRLDLLGGHGGEGGDLAAAGGVVGDETGGARFQDADSRAVS